MNLLEKTIASLTFLTLGVQSMDLTCNKMQVDRSVTQREVNGYYQLKYRCSDIGGSPVYQQYHSFTPKHYDSPIADVCVQAVKYMFFYSDRTWTGWIIGTKPCNKDIMTTCARVSTTLTNPEDTHTWKERLLGSGNFSDSPIEVTCEDTMSNGVFIVISIACTMFVLLLAMAPMIWIYIAKKKKSTRPPATGNQVQSHREPVQVPEPPAYTSDPPPVYTIEANTENTQEIPSYVNDVTFIIANRQDIHLPPPPSYTNSLYSEPPTYQEICLTTDNMTRGSERHRQSQQEEIIEMTTLSSRALEHSEAYENTSCVTED